MSWRLRLFSLLWCLAATVSHGADATKAVVDAMAATFKITNASSTASCFVVSRSHTTDTRRQEFALVTAAHVFEKMNGDECQIVLREKGADGVWTKKETPLKIRAGDKPLWVKHPALDVAALKLDLPADQLTGALEFDWIASESAIRSGALKSADEVWILCYPAKMAANGAGFPVLRRGSVATYPLDVTKENQTYLVDFSTFGGDSGGLVIIRSDRVADRKRRPLVVGMVLGQHRETTKTKSPIEERTTHRSLGLAIVVHAEFIRQTIDRIPD